MPIILTVYRYDTNYLNKQRPSFVIIKVPRGVKEEAEGMQEHHEVYQLERDELSIVERLATLEAELRNSKLHDEELKATLVKVTDAMGELASATKVNATRLADIQNELAEVKKKADFIPNTLMAAVIATAVTFGITSLSNASARQHEKVVEKKTEAPLIMEDKGVENGTGSN